MKNNSDFENTFYVIGICKLKCTLNIYIKYLFNISMLSGQIWDVILYLKFTS